MINQIGGKNKTLGQYYTPDYIVNYIVDQTIGRFLKSSSYNRICSLKILDPACGLGIFLVRSLESLLSYFESIERTNELTLTQVRKSIIANQLYGIDIDRTQIAETQKNLNCQDFNLNFKIFNALIPPATYEHQCEVYSLEELRFRYKEHFINGSEIFSSEKEKREISDLEKRIKQNLRIKLTDDFQISTRINPMPWETVFPETDGRFDVILGNPPWGATLFSSKLLSFYSVGTQQVDSWSLFIERSMIALRDGGRLGFVIPNTLLLNENYSDIRKLILNSCRINNIINLGENVFPGITQPCMIIIAEKGSMAPNHHLDIVQYIPPPIKRLLKEGHQSLSSLPTVSCHQNRFLSNIDYQFNIFSIGYEEFREAIEKDFRHEKIQVKPLRDFVVNARGVELNKNGRIIQCSSCGWWSSPPGLVKNGIKTKQCANPECQQEITEYDKTDFIVFNNPKHPERDYPFLVGHHIQRYYIQNQKYIDPTRTGINYKDPTLYQGSKLLLRKTGKGIRTVIDYDNRWVNQVVYLFKLKKNISISLEYIMGVLNSRLITKYFFIEFADPHRQDFPHFTQKKFLRLPIKVPLTEKEVILANQLAKKAKVLQSQYQKKYSLQQRFQENNLNLERLNQKIELLEKEIDDIVFELYEITPKLNREVFYEFST
ncbi:MAG: Eco57I restriction-modification methylase domain-containing protein [Promethearchaeota archaeon]